jgi:hypothetical protein
MVKKEKEGPGLLRGVLLAYAVLALHVLLVACLGLLVIFFRGIVNYMFWIFTGGTTLILISAYLFYRRIKREGKNLKDILNSPPYRGRSMEVSLLGGIATIRMGNPDQQTMIESGTGNPTQQLEDPDTVRVRELMELARLRESDLITLEEYNSAKKKLFNS